MSKIYMVALEVETDHDGIDEEKVAKEVARLVTEAAKGIGRAEIKATVFNPGEEIDDSFIEAEVTDIGCGDLNGFVTVDFSMDDENHIVADDVQLDTGEALSYINGSLESPTVRVTQEEC